MGMEIEIVRKEMIKPSSPTPQHLEEHKLSIIDQTIPFLYIPLIFFYEAHQIQADCLVLKNSLSKALTHYYPLAGRVRDNSVIDCNDSGALFVEAKVDVDLLQIITNPDMDHLKQLFPLASNGQEVSLAVQINKMDCGGSAIAVQMSHKLGDGHSLVMFMNTWAAISRGDAEIKPPVFDSASIFPPTDVLMKVEKTVAGLVSKEKIVTKRIVFDKEKLDILKHTAASQIDDPTRVEVVSALIWKHFLEANKHASGDKKVFAALQAVNLRPRMNPSLPDHTFGNIIVSSIALHEVGGDFGYQALVRKLRVAVKTLNESFRLQNPEEIFSNMCDQEIISKKEVESFYFSSWSRFPVYEVEFGWGKPVWVTTTTIPFRNIAVILGTKTGDGLEVWINMLEEDASTFETE